MLEKVRYRKPPGPTAWPLIGQLLHMNSTTESFYVTLDRWAKENYGPIFTVNMGPMEMVVLNDYVTVHEALVEKGKYK